MFVGHFAVGFEGKRMAPKVSLATLILTAAFSDVLWILFFLAGIEKVVIQPGLMVANSLNLVYIPFSHSLLMDAFWGRLYGFWGMILLLTALWLIRLRGDPPPSLPALAVVNTVFFAVVLVWASWMNRSRSATI